jgi:hypothetical protein
VTAIYRRVRALWDETRADGNPWKMRLETAFPRATADTGLLRAEQELRDEGWELAGSTFTRDGQYMLPVYEAPMIDVFDQGREAAVLDRRPRSGHRPAQERDRPAPRRRGPPRGTRLELGMAVRLAHARE